MKDKIANVLTIIHSIKSLIYDLFTVQGQGQGHTTAAPQPARLTIILLKNTHLSTSVS